VPPICEYVFACFCPAFHLFVCLEQKITGEDLALLNATRLRDEFWKLSLSTRVKLDTAISKLFAGECKS